MTTTIFIVALLIALVGVLGSILPLLPGVALSLLAMILVEFATPVDFGSTIWSIALALIVLSFASDYIFPIVGAKQGGGTKAGTRGSIIGMLLGFFFAPRGILLGPLLGAWLGEWYVKKDAKHALKAARGSFLGSVGSSVVKLSTAGVVVYWIIAAWTTL